MRAGIAWGRHTLDLEVRAPNFLAGHRADSVTDLADPVAALRDALENPLDYPALRLALIPDDHVAIVVDEGIPHLDRLLVPLLEHIRQANVQPDAITLVCPPLSSSQPWVDDLPDEFEEVHVEVHQPGDRRKLAYLGTTKQDLRIYLNRSVVDADQAVVLARRGYDPRVGYSGAEAALYPGMADEPTRQEIYTDLHHRAPGDEPWPIQQEARDVTWHLGAPFFVQLIEGAGDAISSIVTGPFESSLAGQRLLNARWRVEFDQAADVVIAGISGDPALHTLDDLAAAYFAAARVVKPGGSIVLLSEITPTLGPGFEQFRRHDDPSLAMGVLMQEKPSDLAACFQWATAANQARLYLLSGLPGDVAEELFTIPLQRAEQAQKLLTEDATCILLPDAHRTLAVLR